MNIVDETIYNLIMKMYCTPVTGIMMFISYLGSAITFITLAIAFIFLLKKKKYSRMLILDLGLVFILNIILKYIIRRPRPPVVRIMTATGYSFPSGHAMVSIGFYGLLIYYIYKNIESKKLKNTLIAILSLLILLIGISRIYVGLHYATDVIGGYIIGIIYLVLFIKYVYNKKTK